MTDAEARHAIGVVLLRAYAARPNAPADLAALIDKLDAVPSTQPKRRR